MTTHAEQLSSNPRQILEQMKADLDHPTMANMESLNKELDALRQNPALLKQVMAADLKSTKLDGFPQVTMAKDGSIHLDASGPNGHVDVVQTPGAKNQEGSLTESAVDANGHMSGTSINEHATVAQITAAAVAAASGAARIEPPTVVGKDGPKQGGK